jgi:hypothetical protein
MASTVKLLTDICNVPVKILHSIFVGIVGTILVVGFLSTFLHVFTVAKLTPFVIALNSLITGYYLIDKTRDQLQRKQTTVLIVAASYVLLTFVIINMFFLYSAGGHLFPIYHLAGYLIVGIVCTELGSMLAIKYFRLNK